MLFYIFWGFTAFMLLVWVVVVLLTLIRGNAQKRSWKEILKILFKRVGIVIVAYIILFYVGGYMFMGAHKQQCSANAKDVAVMTPQAEVITKYILENGIPESLIKIPNLPYKLKNCERESHNYQKCYFNIQDKKYSVIFDVLVNRVYMKIYNRKSDTGLMFGFKKNENEEWVIRRNITPYSTKNDGICNPMRM